MKTHTNAAPRCACTTPTWRCVDELQARGVTLEITMESCSMPASTMQVTMEMPPASTTHVETVVRSRWEPCLGTGVPLLVAVDAPQFRLDEAGNVLPIGGDAMTFAGHTPTAGGVGVGPRRSRVAATHTQAPRCVTEPSGCRPLCTATPPPPPHGNAATPRKRCLAPRALLPSPVSVTDDLAPTLATPPAERPADCEGADALSAVLKLAEAVRRCLDS